MKRFAIDLSDRVARLKQRLGLQTKRWKIRIKIGGWITLTPPMLKSLRLSAGDVIEWTLTPRGVEWQRKPAKLRATRNWRRLPRRLGQYETVVFACRPSFKRHHSSETSKAGVPNSDIAARNAFFHAKPHAVDPSHECDPGQNGSSP